MLNRYIQSFYTGCITSERASARESRHEGSAVTAADTHSESSGLAHSSLQKRHQVRSARVRRHTVFDILAPHAEHSADVLVQPRPQTPAKCGFFRRRAKRTRRWHISLKDHADTSSSTSLSERKRRFECSSASYRMKSASSTVRMSGPFFLAMSP